MRPPFGKARLYFPSKEYPAIGYSYLFLRMSFPLNFCFMTNKWMSATRPWSLPASIMPAITALAYVFLWQENFPARDWAAGIMAMIGAAIFHLAGNLISDYFDYQHGVDSHNNIGQTNLSIIDGILSPKAVLIYGFILLTIGCALGLFLVIRCGLPILYMGVAGLVLTLFYFRMKFSALGDINIFISFGLLIALGVVYAATGIVYPKIFTVSAAEGLLIVAILHANNTRDRINDAQSGISTLAMKIGLKYSKLFYILLIAGAYLLVAVDVCWGILPLTSILVLISTPLAWANIRSMLNARDMRQIAALDASTAKLVLLFSLLLSLSCFIHPLAEILL